MVFIKQWIGIAGLAGVLTAGVTSPTWMARDGDVPSEAASAVSEMSDAKERLRVGLSTARAQTMAIEGRMAIPDGVPSPGLAETPSTGTPAAAPPADGPSPVPAQASPPAADRRWVPTPRPELVAKADERFDNGDVAGARLWLEAALDAGDADAAFRLAETYDPAKLTEWRIVGVASDVSKARALYERAADGGVEAARQRISRLAP